VPPGGGYGGYPPPGYQPPPPPPNHTRRNVLIAVGAVVVIGAVVAGVVLAGGGSDKKSNDAKTGTTSSSASLPSGLPSDGLPSDGLPSDGLPSGLPSDLTSPLPIPSFTLPSDLQQFTGTPTPTQKLVPYVVLHPGQCFDAPTLTPSVDKVTTRSCSSAHDAQVVANETLSGSFSSDEEIQSKALELCTADARKHLPADGRMYYPYALFPKLITYQIQGRDTVTCSLTRNNGKTGTKLYAPLG
jgi:hypothetical protein